MTSLTRRRLLGAGAGLGLAGLLSGCGLGTAGGFSPRGTLAGPLKSIPPLEGARISVGSKNFTEQILLGKIAVMLFKSAGATVRDYTNIPGSSSARQAHVTGQIDFMWEYTGTAWIAYLGHDNPIPDEQGQYEAVRDEDLERHQLVWLPPAPMNNTYGFAVRRTLAQELGITRMSQLPSVPQARRTFCVESEFRNRNDGLEPMLKTYGVPLGQGVQSQQIKILDTGAIYAATSDGLCSFGEVFNTDGRIKALDLVVLEDDKSYFPKYNVCGVVHAPLLEEHPQLADLLGPVSEELSDETLIELNAQVDVDGREAVDVAWDWLLERGYLTA
ncbi:glycine betaine ABC transporter substrate-binding protein [Luteococcus sp. OSA5]|uniref:glycine betaine ABC transporter substrate-binding protein n=1 Tax=Luteococcus sp. OSA5 TaxID=3401630 RepID=UPI003B429939